MNRTRKQSWLGELVELRPTGCVGRADQVSCVGGADPVGWAGSASALKVSL
jgi:hypothetical protein